MDNKTTRAKPQYYAISCYERTTIYNKNGEQRIVPAWDILCGPCESREEAQQKAEENIGPIFQGEVTDGNEIYRDTLHKNKIIVTKSQLRKYRISLEQ